MYRNNWFGGSYRNSPPNRIENLNAFQLASAVREYSPEIVAVPFHPEGRVDLYLPDQYRLRICLQTGEAELHEPLKQRRENLDQTLENLQGFLSLIMPNLICNLGSFEGHMRRKFRKWDYLN